MNQTGESPDTLAERGKRAYQKGDLIAAIDAFTAAEMGYRGQEALVKAAEMANNLSVVLLQADRPQDALAAARETPQTFEEAQDLERCGMAWGNLGAALEACKDYDAAAEAYQKAIDIFRSRNLEDNLLQTAQALSRLRMQQGRVPEALTAMQGGLQDPKKLSWRHRVLRKILDIPSRLMGH